MDNVRTALEDIQNLRMTKIRNGLQTIARQARNDATTFSVKMNNVGALEILSVRSFLTGARARLYTPAAKRALTRKYNATHAKLAEPKKLGSAKARETKFTEDGEDEEGDAADEDDDAEAEEEELAPASKAAASKAKPTGKGKGKGKA